MGETYYDVLGVASDATQAEITAAYRERVLETHPDRNDDPDASSQFKRVTEAESVLSDEDERARYDRLGHEAYVGRGEHGSGSSRDGSGGVDSATDSRAGASSDSRGANWRRYRADTEAERSGPSHHARHRYRRQWRTATESSRPFDRASDREGVDASATGGEAGIGATRGGATSHSEATGDGSRSTASTAGSWTGAGGDSSTGDRSSPFEPADAVGRGSARRTGFAVHSWDDEIDVGDPYRAFNERTAVVTACLTVLYPMLVYASVTSQFPVFVNGAAAVCTLVLVGFMLTMPRIALASFGTWSVVVPFVLPQFPGVHPLSLPGLFVVAAFWIPFGYALAVWWALRG